MTTHSFRVEEVIRNGYIAWNAIDESSDDTFPLNEDGYFVAGTFPEITTHLKKKGVNITVAYDENHSDKLRNNTWYYSRGKDQVVVKDIPRTVFRIYPQ